MLASACRKICVRVIGQNLLCYGRVDDDGSVPGLDELDSSFCVMAG